VGVPGVVDPVQDSDSVSLIILVVHLPVVLDRIVLDRRFKLIVECLNMVSETRRMIWVVHKTIIAIQGPFDLCLIHRLDFRQVDSLIPWLLSREAHTLDPRIILNFKTSHLGSQSGKIFLYPFVEVALESTLQALNSQNFGVNRVPSGETRSGLFPFAPSKKYVLLPVSFFEQFSVYDLLGTAISHSKPSEFKMILGTHAISKQIECLLCTMLAQGK
jgi:hypothetical protein